MRGAVSSLIAACFFVSWINGVPLGAPLSQREPEPAPLAIESLKTLTSEDMEGRVNSLASSNAMASAMNERTTIAESSHMPVADSLPAATPGSLVLPVPAGHVPDLTAPHNDKLTLPTSDGHHVKLKVFSTDPPKDPSTMTEGKPELFDIAIVIPTVRRYAQDHSPAPERYLVPLVNKLWADLTPEEKPHVKFFILNSDREPEKHVEAESLRQHPGVTVFTKVANKEEIVKSVAAYSSLEDGREVSSDWLSWVASENVDGAFLFEKAKLAAPYILFLEDDVWPTTSALRKLSDFMHEFEKSHTDDWLFVDLYTPNLDWAPGMLNVENGAKYPFQCCTQAMLFKSDKIDGVADYWRSHSREPVDDNLRNYMKNEHPEMSVFAVRPNLFQHVGAYSSNAEKSLGVVEHESLEFISLLL